jgi:hypothetical protein
MSTHSPRGCHRSLALGDRGAISIYKSPKYLVTHPSSAWVGNDDRSNLRQRSLASATRQVLHDHPASNPVIPYTNLPAQLCT